MDKHKINAKWYGMKPAEVMDSFLSGPGGLSQEEVNRRLAEYGPNELKETKKASVFALFIEQFKDFLIVILLIAVGLSAILGETADAIVIFVIVLFAAGLGFIQEYRAERAMEALKKMAAPAATALRNGKEMEVPARELVPGDIVFIKTGDRVPADARLIDSANLKTDEASLTGESTSVDKTCQALEGTLIIGDRKNMVFMGTAGVYGRGSAVVTATGMNTEFGKIATLLQEVKEEKTPLQVNLDKVGKWIAIGALVLCFALAGIGVLRGHDILEMLIWGVSLAVAAVPEALPAVVTISLALGVQKMVRRNALIRKLPAVETLGCTTVICSDKTGTLTQDQMTVRQIFVSGRYLQITGSGYEPKGDFLFDSRVVDPVGDADLRMLLEAGVLCNDTSLDLSDGVWRIKGDPTEGALVVLAAKAGIEQKKTCSLSPRCGEIPFSSETKRMTTLHNYQGEKIAHSKGAVEVILDSCAYIRSNGAEIPITEHDRENITEAAHAMAGRALRVLGLAYRRLDGDTIVSPDVERNMVFAGLVGMIDPPRPEAREAIKRCDEAGIKSVMITGDHKLTAVAVARELGLLKSGNAITGAEIDNMTDAEFEGSAQKMEVYARVSPAHKLKVVEALAKHGHVVAMTGDGVNDAPALKKADIGVAMGITGTDVTKEAADMVLTDDNFASIVASVEEGRGIFSNIKKYLIYLLSCNLGEIILMAVAILFGPLIGLPPGTIPLIAIQLLYVNLATDGLPALALSVDPPDVDVMKQKPRPRSQTIFTRPVFKYLVGAGLWTGLATLAVFIWAINADKDPLEAQGMTFITLILIEIFNAFNCRSLEHSLFKIGPFKNKWLVGSVLLTLAMTIPIFYVPFLQEVFHAYALSLGDWVVAILVGSTIFIAAELYKLVNRWIKRRSDAKLRT